jgi:hypothetical protein
MGTHARYLTHPPAIQPMIAMQGLQSPQQESCEQGEPPSPTKENVKQPVHMGYLEVGEPSTGNRDTDPNSQDDDAALYSGATFRAQFNGWKG